MSDISVIIPSYNHFCFIQDTINSIINQSFDGKINIIIIDDASTDGTRELLQTLDFSKRKNISLNLHLKDFNKGVNDSIEIGMNYVDSKWVQILASDDILIDNKFKIQLIHAELKKCDAIFSRGFLLNENGSVDEYFLNNFTKAYTIGKAHEYLSTKDWGAPLLQSGIIKATVLRDFFELRKRYRSDDWVMMVQLFSKYNVIYLDQPLFIYRQHFNNSYKKFTETFPSRLDVALNFIEDKYKSKLLSNLFASQSRYYLNFGDYKNALKYSLIATLFNMNWTVFINLIIVIMPGRIILIIKYLVNIFKLRKKL